MLSFAKEMEGRRVRQIDHAVLQKWENRSLDAGLSMSTISTDLTVLASMFKWLRVSGIYSGRCPAKAYRESARDRGKEFVIKTGDARTRYLSEAEEDLLLQQIRRDIDSGSRPAWDQNYRMLLTAVILAIDTGMREQELMSLQWSWIDMASASIQVPKHVAKHGARKIPLLRRSYELLASLPSERHGHVLWHDHEGKRRHYTNMDRPLDRALSAAGIPRCVWHDLRRTCGCRLLQGSKTTDGRKLRMETVSKWLGHSSIVVTERHYAFLGIQDLHDEIGTMSWLGTERVPG
jgi:integrase